MSKFQEVFESLDKLYTEDVSPTEVATLTTALVDRAKKKGKVLDSVKAKETAERMLKSDPAKKLSDYLMDLTECKDDKVSKNEVERVARLLLSNVKVDREAFGTKAVEVKDIFKKYINEATKEITGKL